MTVVAARYGARGLPGIDMYQLLHEVFPVRGRFKKKVKIRRIPCGEESDTAI